MAIHLLDTNILIDFLRGRAEARNLLGQCQAAADQLVISVVTVTELWAGMRKGEERATGALLSAFRRIPLSEDIALAAGDMLRTYRRSSRYGTWRCLDRLNRRRTRCHPHHAQRQALPAVTVCRPY